MAIPPPSNQDSAQSVERDRPRVSGRRVVCVVDDDPSVLKSVARLLESEGFSVRTFAHPDESLKYMETNSVPLAILDIWMQEMTGMELLAHLCASSPQTHVIFITGHEDNAAQATVMQAGAFAFFIKPLDDGKFLAAVHGALGDPLLEKPRLVQRARAFLKSDHRVSKLGEVLETRDDPRKEL